MPSASPTTRRRASGAWRPTWSCRPGRPRRPCSPACGSAGPSARPSFPPGWSRPSRTPTSVRVRSGRGSSRSPCAAAGWTSRSCARVPCTATSASACWRRSSGRVTEGAVWTRPQGGFFTWLTLPGDVDSVQIAERAVERGVGVVRDAVLPGRPWTGLAAALVQHGRRHRDRRGNRTARLAGLSRPPGSLDRGMRAPRAPHRVRRVVAEVSPWLRHSSSSVAPVSAFGRPEAAPRLHLGLLGNPARFANETAQRSSTRLVIMSWGQGETPQYFAGLFATMQEVPMLGLSTGGGEGGGAETIDAGQVARGAGDAFLVALNQAIAAWGKPIYIRPFAEMNGHWNAYCAFNRDGSPRSADHSTAAFRRAFARIYLLVHGAPDVNRRLRQLGLPPVKGALATNPQVRVIWNPQGYGSPDLAGNSAAVVLPGRRVRGRGRRRSLRHRRQGGLVGRRRALRCAPAQAVRDRRVGALGRRRRSFVSRMAAFVRRHRRGVVANYYSGKSRVGVRPPRSPGHSPPTGR